MLVGPLSKLAEFLEEGSLPAWLGKAIDERKKELARGELVVIHGPRGELVTIKPRRMP